MGLCWQRRSSTIFFISWLCLATSTTVTAQTIDECVLSEEQCASPRMGWFSHINAERAPGIESFTAVDLSWDPTTRREYVITYRDLNSSYMLSMQIVRRESYRLDGLEHNTSYIIAVCQPSVNESFLSQLDEPLLNKECGHCSTCHTTRAAQIEVTLASHDIDLNADTDIFECQASGLPRPNSITWTAIDPNTNERVQLADGERGIHITQESLLGNDRLSFLEAPIDEDLLISGQINCVASNGLVEDVADTRRFIEEDVTPTRETTEQFIPNLNSTVTLPAWAIGLIVVVLVTLVVGMIVIFLLMFGKYHHLKKSGKASDSSVELAHKRHKSNDYYSAREINNTNELEDSFSLSIAKDKIIPSSNIKLSKVIGQGEFGVVYKGTLSNESSCEMVAVKTLKGIFATDADIKNATDEILKMQSFNHPNVMTLIGVCVSGGVGESGGPSIVMPYMSKGSLLDYLRKEGSGIKPTIEDDVTQIGSVEKLLMQICLQISKGMDYLAGLKFVHRDLAARNCMISCNGNIKVADFGLAEDVYMRNYFRQSEGSSAKLPIKWMALESLKLGVFSEKSDVWSYGVTCWEVFTAGEIPYPGVHPREVIKLIEEGERMDKPKNAACSDKVNGLIASCWESEPDNRPTFSEIVASLDSQLLGLADYLDLNIVTADGETEP